MSIEELGIAPEIELEEDPAEIVVEYLPPAQESRQALEHARRFAEISSASGEISGDSIYKAWREYVNWKRVKGNDYAPANGDKKGKDTQKVKVAPSPVWHIMVALQGDHVGGMSREAMLDEGHAIFLEDVMDSVQGKQGLFDTLSPDEVDNSIDFCLAMDEVGWVPGDLSAKYPTTAVAPYTYVSEYADSMRKSPESNVADPDRQQ